MSNQAAAARPPLGVLIMEAREAKDMSQSDLARAVGVSRGAVGQWETGKTKPNPRNIRKLSAVLNVPVARFEIYTTEDETADNPDPELPDIVRFPTKPAAGTIIDVVVDNGCAEVKAYLVDKEGIDRLIKTLQAKRPKLPDRGS